MGFIVPVLAVIGGGSAVAGGVAVAGAAAIILQGIGAAQQASQQADLAETNAALARQDAEEARFRAEAQAEDIRDARRRAIGAQRSGFGKAGVTAAGTPLLVFGETAAEAEKAILRAMRGGAIEESRFLTEAKSSKKRASGLRTAGRFAFGTSLLSAGSTIGGASKR
ncbi:hypothetical protein LCGC14_1181460 [marine sediment metagenome]|uniref:Uncharacterized protein n=1 Tax=marine sediment metagenome TaxID=412755 RepID=A0A0F9M9Q5_9ZZZZ